MSIGTIQEKFLGKGCGTIAVVICGVIFAGVGFQSCGRNADGGAAAGQGAQNVVASVGGVPIPAEEIERLANDQQQQALQMAAMQGGATPASLPARDIARAYESAASQAFQRSAVVYLAEKNGATFSPEEISRAVDSWFDQQLETEKFRLIQNKQLKFDSTPQEFEAAVKKSTGKSIADLRAENKKQVTEALKDPEKASSVKALFARDVLLDRLAAKVNPSEEDVRESFKTYTVKRIFIKDGSGPTQPAQTRAQAALDAIKSGMSFEAAMDKYSAEPPQSPKKKVSENTTTVSGSMMAASPEYKDLKGKAVGYVSGIIDVPGGKAIDKIVAEQPNLPKDYEAKKAKYREDYAKQLATTEAANQLKALLDSSAVKWQSEGYEALFDVARAGVDPTATPTAAYGKAAQEARNAIKSGTPADDRVAAYALLLASDAVYNDPRTNKAKAIDARIETLTTVLSKVDDYDLQMELADLYAQKKNGEGALNALLAASRANNSYDAQGQRRWGDIAAKGVQFKANGVLTDAQLTTLQNEQARWTQSKTNYDKVEAEAKKQEEEARRANEAEIKRQQEEAAKQKSAAPGTSTGGSLMPTPAPTTAGGLGGTPKTGTSLPPSSGAGR